MANLSNKNRVLGSLKGLFVPCLENGLKPRIFENDVFSLIIGLMLGFKILSVISFGNYLGADIFNQISSSDLYSLTNQTRQANGLPALTPNSKLEAAAQLKMTDMFNNNYFAHNSPQGTTPWYWFGKANYKYSAAGENLAMNFYSSDQVMKAWMASELHKKNILLKNFSEIGIAIGYDKLNGEKTMVVVEMFGSPETKTIFSKSVTTKQVTANLIIPTPTPKISIKPTPTPSLVKESKLPPVSLGVSKTIKPQVKSAETEIANNTIKAETYPTVNLMDKIMGMLLGFFAIATLIKIFVTVERKFSVLMVKPAMLMVAAVVLILLNDGVLNFGQIIIK